MRALKFVVYGTVALVLLFGAAFAYVSRAPYEMPAPR